MKLRLRRSTWVLMALFVLTLVTYLSMTDPTPAASAGPTSVINEETPTEPRQTFSRRTAPPSRPPATSTGSGTPTVTSDSTDPNADTGTEFPTADPSISDQTTAPPTGEPTTQAEPQPESSPAPALGDTVPAPPPP